MALYQVLPLYLLVDQMLYPSHLGEIRVCPITRMLGKFFRPIRAELLVLWKLLVGHKRGVQNKVSLLLTVL